MTNHVVPKAFQSKMETTIFSLEEVDKWRLPPFQRPLRVNNKVMALSEDLKSNGGVLTGVITLGLIGRDKTVWLVDGQHRIEGFKISGLKEIICDARTVFFDNMGEMGEEFVNLNSRLVTMRPDDILRGMEDSTPVLKHIRQHCEFIGYDQIRRGNASGAILSMSLTLRAWVVSSFDTPAANGVTGSAGTLPARIDGLSADHLISFLNLAYTAWGRDRNYGQLWGALNMTLCMWLYRRMVLDRNSATKRYATLTVAQFKHCLMALSADEDYIAWLRGRTLTEFHRTPTYSRIRNIIRNVILGMPGFSATTARLPSPEWAASGLRGYAKVPEKEIA